MRKRNFKLPISDLEVPKVLGGEQRVVLHDPGDSLVSVAVEDVHLLCPPPAQVLPQLLQRVDLYGQQEG